MGLSEMDENQRPINREQGTAAIEFFITLEVAD